VVDEELSSSSPRPERLDVPMNLLFADFILRRRASVPSKLSPVNNNGQFIAAIYSDAGYLLDRYEESLKW